MAPDQRVAVNADRLVHHRRDDVLGDVHQLEDVHARVHTHAVEHGVEHLERRVARAGAQACYRAVNAPGTRLDRGQ